MQVLPTCQFYEKSLPRFLYSRFPPPSLPSMRMTITAHWPSPSHCSLWLGVQPFHHLRHKSAVTRMLTIGPCSSNSPLHMNGWTSNGWQPCWWPPHSLPHWHLLQANSLPPPLSPMWPNVTQYLQDFAKIESPIDQLNDDNRPKPHDVQPSLSLQDTFVLQLKVMKKLNTMFDKLNKKLDHYLTALTCPPTNLNTCCIMHACMTPATILNLPCPSLFLEPIPVLVSLKPHTALVSTKIIPYVNPIPATPPYSHEHCHLVMIQTKDQMHPP